jgi:hypothetical protein
VYLASQLALVAGVELSDDLFHAVTPQRSASTGLAHALQLVNLERAHGLWVEPGIQQFFAGTHHVLGQTIGWAQARLVADALYGQGHVFFTLAFAIWIYCCRRPLFSFIRNVFLLTTMLAVLGYETFPLAPPRLAQGLTFEGRPYHFLDAVFGSSGVKIGFNEYAAMPSLHVAWALIVGLTVAVVARPIPMRLLGAVYPVIMAITVIVTGNHYIADGLGAALAVGTATALSVVLARRAALAAWARHALACMLARPNGARSAPASARRPDRTRAAA